MDRVKVEGIDYSPEGIEDIRQAMVVLRNAALDQAAMAETVALSHVIALLADYKWLTITYEQNQAEMKTADE